MSDLTPCRCPCHTNPQRDIHVSQYTRAVIWCCHAPFAQPAPMVPPTPTFETTVIEVKPMEAPKGAIFYMDYRHDQSKKP